MDNFGPKVGQSPAEVKTEVMDKLATQFGVKDPFVTFSRHRPETLSNQLAIQFGAIPAIGLRAECHHVDDGYWKHNVKKVSYGAEVKPWYIHEAAVEGKP